MSEKIWTRSKSTLSLAGRGKQALSPFWTGGITAKTLPNLTQPCRYGAEPELTDLVSRHGSLARAQHRADDSSRLPVRGWVTSAWLQAPAGQPHVFLPPAAQPYSGLFAQRQKTLQPHSSTEWKTLHCQLGIGIETGLCPILLKLFVSKLKQPPNFPLLFIWGLASHRLRNTELNLTQTRVRDSACQSPRNTPADRPFQRLEIISVQWPSGKWGTSLCIYFYFLLTYIKIICIRPLKLLNPTIIIIICNGEMSRTEILCAAWNCTNKLEIPSFFFCLLKAQLQPCSQPLSSY